MPQPPGTEHPPSTQNDIALGSSSARLSNIGIASELQGALFLGLRCRCSGAGTRRARRPPFHPKPSYPGDGCNVAREAGLKKPRGKNGFPAAVTTILHVGSPMAQQLPGEVLGRVISANITNSPAGIAR